MITLACGYTDATYAAENPAIGSYRHAAALLRGTMSVATQKSPLVAIVRLLVRGQMGQLLLPEEQVLPVSARPSRGRGLGNRRQVLHEWGPLAGHQWGFLHGHVQTKRRCMTRYCRTTA